MRKQREKGGKNNKVPPSVLVEERLVFTEHPTSAERLATCGREKERCQYRH
jgi:hypothetical protein